MSRARAIAVCVGLLIGLVSGAVANAQDSPPPFHRTLPAPPRAPRAPGSLPGATPCSRWLLFEPTQEPISERAGHSAIYDPFRRRMIVFGGRNELNDTWVLPLDATPGPWTRLATSGTKPGPRSGHCAVFDPVRDRMIVIGGTGYGFDLNNVWALSLNGTPTWTLLDPAGAPPPPRRNFGAIYDPRRDRIIVFGGESNAAPDGMNDLWSLTLTGRPTWTPLAATGTPPSPRRAPGVVYDPRRDRMLVIGGSLRDDEPAAFALSLASPAWSEMVAAGNAPHRVGVGVVYDDTRDRVLVYGGTSANDTVTTDLFELHLDEPPAWDQVEVTEWSVPPARRDFSLIWDAFSARAVLCGGSSADGQQLSGDVFTNPARALSLSVTVLEPGGGMVRRDPESSCYEPGAQVTLTAVPYSGVPYTGEFMGWSGDLAGSENPVTITMDRPRSVFARFGAMPVVHLTRVAEPSVGGAIDVSPGGIHGSGDDTYVAGTQVMLTARPRLGFVFRGWAGDISDTTNPVALVMDTTHTVVARFEQSPASCGGWTMLAVDGLRPRASRFVQAAYDSRRDRMLAFGGDFTRTSDVWALDLATDTWSPVPTSPGPSPRGGCGVVYDPLRDHLLVIGGFNQEEGVLNEVWQLDLTSGNWSEWSSMGFPYGQENLASVVYDPRRDRVLLFGGGNGLNAYNNQVWELTLSGAGAWSPLVVGGTPPAARFGAIAVIDSARDRLLIVSGATPSGPIDDAWQLSLADSSSWTPLATIGPHHPPAELAYGAFDPVRSRIVVFGGGDPLGYRAHVLAVGSGATWAMLTPPGTVPANRWGGSAIYDPVRDRFVIFGGYDGRTLDETLALQLGNAVDVSASPPEGGQVIRRLARSCYDEGELVTLIPTPAEGYRFARWEGELTGTENPVTLTVHGSRAIVAVFEPAVAADPTAKSAPGEVALATALTRVYPNPATSDAAIEYSLARPGAVSLAVYDIAGREVARLAEGRAEAGTHRTRWDLGTRGGPARSGIYFVRYRADSRMWQRRLLVVR